jgi:PAS domain S-box-containing protein
MQWSNGMKILVVDDQYINRYFLEKLLEGYGYSVISAIDGVEALEKLTEETFDLIISDILLPRMDGFQLCREIKMHPEYKTIPFIFYSAAYNEPKDREFGENLGADRFIVKPTDPEEFISIIREVLEKLSQEMNDEPGTITLGEHEYLTEHNKRLIRQLEKKLAELEHSNAALRKSEKRYKNLFENANDAIILHIITPTNEFGRILEANGGASLLLGYTHEELLDTSMAKIDNAQKSEHYQEFLANLLEFKHLTFDGEYISKDSKIIPVEISAHLYEENGSRFCLVVIRDRRFREESMKKIEETIHQIAIVGDQIRNPLSVIMTACEECPSSHSMDVGKAIQKIETCIQNLDKGTLESEKVRRMLMRLYGSHQML